MFIFYTLVAVIAVILISDSFSNALVVLSIVFNMILLCLLLGVIPGQNLSMVIQPKQGLLPTMQPPTMQLPTIQPPVVPSKPPAESFNPVFDNLYGTDWNNYDAYKMTYFDYPKVTPYAESSPDLQLGVDQSCAYYAQRRTRDKKQMDGIATKDANFYKYHFYDELEQSENKPWWGRSEF